MDAKDKRSKRSKVWLFPKNEFADLVRNSVSLSQISRGIGLGATTGVGIREVRNRIAEDGLDKSHLTGKSPTCQSQFLSKIPLEEVLVENSTYSRSSLKKRLIETGRLDNKCAECNMSPFWNGKTLVLRLDHINGVYNDNRENNLRLLCPNCDSQQPTFSGANRKLTKYFCIDCGEEILKGSQRCSKCLGKTQERIDWPSDEELGQMVRETNRFQTSKKLGISWVALDKRLKNHKISL